MFSRQMCTKSHVLWRIWVFCSSFDFMSMLGEIEDTFDVEIEQTKAAEIRTVQEAVDYLETLKDA